MLVRAPHSIDPRDHRVCVQDARRRGTLRRLIGPLGAGHAHKDPGAADSGPVAEATWSDPPSDLERAREPCRGHQVLRDRVPLAIEADCVGTCRDAGRYYF